MSTQPQGSKWPLLPKLFGFDRLFFAGVEQHYQGRTLWSQRDVRKHVGLPIGSTMVLRGHPGSGKTTFALSLVRDLLHQNTKADPHGGIATCYFVNVELGRTELQNVYRDMGWFSEHDPLFGDAQRLVLLHPELELDRPVACAEDLINRIFHVLEQKLVQREEPGRCAVVVDSLTALLKDCEHRGEERRLTREFIHRLHVTLKTDPDVPAPALSLLISEEPDEPSEGVAVEEYVGDFVIRLGRADRGAGRRLRTLDIVKSRGAKTILGESTWAILDGKTVDTVISLPGLQAHIRKITPIESTKERWGTVAIFPRPVLRAIGRRFTEPHGEKGVHERWLGTGTDGLDEMLRSRPEYWAAPEAIRSNFRWQPGALERGSTTLILAPTGLGKTSLCLQFLRGPIGDTRATRASKKDAILITFESTPEDVHAAFKKIDPAFEFSKRVHHIRRRRGNLDLNVLISELASLLRDPGRIERIAIDGLGGLLVGTREHENAAVIETLLSFIRERKHGRQLTVFVTCEAHADNAEEMALGFSGLVDNVVILHPVRIDDRLRHAVYVRKGTRGLHDPLVRELIARNPDRGPLQLAIVPGLEGYKGLLGATPEPLDVSLQMFAENDDEKEFNQWQIADLGTHFGYKVKSIGFSQGEIARSMEEARSDFGGRVPHSDIRLLYVDEWWVREHATKNHPLLKLVPFESGPTVVAEPTVKPSVSPARLGATTDRDFWSFEIDKGALWTERERGPEDESPLVVTDLLALPAYTDFGLFCVDTELLRELCASLPESTVGAGPMRKLVEELVRRTLPRHNLWRELINCVPQKWVNVVKHQDGEGLEFSDPDAASFGKEGATIVDWLAAAVQPDPANPNSRRAGYEFDVATHETVVCHFLELAWSFGEPESFLIDNVREFGAERDDCEREAWLRSLPATQALSFLGYLVAHGLMTLQSASAEGKQPLFSRQFYSTVPRQGFNGFGPVMLLPFFPVAGKGTEQANAENDVFTRLKRTEARLREAARQRHIALGDQSSERRKIEAKELRELEDDVIRKLRKLESEIDACLKGMPNDVWQPTETWSANFCSAAAALLRQPLQDVIKSESLDEEKPPPSPGLTIDDIKEVLAWTRSRVRLILFGRAAATISLDEPIPPDFPRQEGSATGYPCTGSWLVGVARDTHSPGLAAKFIERVVSLEYAVQRTRVGAGIPVRKDFYRLHGEEPVKHAEYMNWHQLLQFCGARARRRDRLLCRHVGASEIYAIIHDEVLSIMGLADRLRRERAKTTAGIVREFIQPRAAQGIARVLTVVLEKTKAARDGKRGHCGDCRASVNCWLREQGA